MGRNTSKFKPEVVKAPCPSPLPPSTSPQDTLLLLKPENTVQRSPSSQAVELAKIYSQFQSLEISLDLPREPSARAPQPYVIPYKEEPQCRNGKFAPTPPLRRKNTPVSTSNGDGDYCLIPVKPAKTKKTSATTLRSNDTKYSAKFKYEHYGKLIGVTGLHLEQENVHTSIVAVDCEMVGIGTYDESVLARVSIVNRYGYCIYDSFAKPKEPVTHYRTDKSGVRQEDIINAPLHDVVIREVRTILKGKIVIGHSVHNDFEALQINHPWDKIRDTEIYYRELMNRNTRVSLRSLCNKFLQTKIQGGEHSSIVDAQVTMELYLREEANWEAKFTKTIQSTVAPPNLTTWRQMTVFPRQPDLFRKEEFVHPIKENVAYKSAEEYLDTQFRLLREDFMKPLRQGIQDYQHWLANGKRVTPKTVRIYENVRMRTSGQRNETKRVQTLIFPVHQRVIDMSSMTENSRFLLNGSLLLLTLNPSIGEPDFRKVKLATVFRSEDDECDVRDGILNVNFVPDGPTWRVDSNTKFTVLESVAFFEAYRYALESLQAMYLSKAKFPLGKYILDPTIPFNKIDYDVQMFDFSKQIINFDRTPVVKYLGFPSAHALGLSASQFEAYHSALTKEVAIIQGPPGTGKTYIAMQVIKFFLCNEHVLNKRPLVVVSNTNHSLDHLFEKVILYAREMSGSISTGNDLVLRIGGRSKSELVQSVTCYGKKNMFLDMKTIEKKIKATMMKLDILKEMPNLKTKIVSDLESAKLWLKSAKGSLCSSSNKTSNLSPKDTEEVTLEVSVYEVVVLILKGLNPSLGMKQVLLHSNPLLKNLKSKLSQLIPLVEERLKTLQGDWQELKGSKSEAQFLRSARVLGMTVTGSVKNKIRILQKLKPELVIVEEAAHVIEATVVAGLTEHCRRLILIGDHKQLRPSTADYHLTKTNHLDVSMMERFVRNAEAKGMQTWTQLDVQRRMRPEIARLVHPTIYPTLCNHADVTKYPNVKGMKKNLFFVDHDQVDSQEESSTSFVNLKEADFLFNLCRYLVGQGNKPCQISIITTYLGQRLKLEKLMLRTPFAKSVRVCCVDGFQGEENDIILLSLVRSNDKGNIGFLSTDNRLCVALSRARHGLYIVGNMTRLAARSQTWRDIQETLMSENRIGKELELQCERHGGIVPVGINGSKKTFNSLHYNEQGCLCPKQKIKKPVITVVPKKKPQPKKVSTIVVSASVSPLFPQKKEFLVVTALLQAEAQAHLKPEVKVDTGCEKKFTCGHSCAMPACDKSHINYNCKEKCARACNAGHKCSGKHACYLPCDKLINCTIKVEKPCDSCGITVSDVCYKLYLYFGKKQKSKKGQMKTICTQCKKTKDLPKAKKRKDLPKAKKRKDLPKAKEN